MSGTRSSGPMFRNTKSGGDTEMTPRERELLAELEATRRQLEMVVNNVDEVCVMLDRDLRCIYVNDRMVESRGWPREQIVGRSFTEVFPDLAETLLETELKRVIRQQVSVHFEYHDVLQGRWFENRAYPMPGGVTLLTREITERKNAERAVQSSEERFRALTNLMDQQVWINDPQGRPIYANDRWYAYTGLTQRSGLQQWMDLLHPEEVIAVNRIWTAGIATGRPYELQYRLRRHDGEYRWHVARVVPSRGGDGKIEYWIVTATDLHDLKVAQEQLRQNEERFRALVVASSQCVWRRSADPTRQEEGQAESKRWWQEVTGQNQEASTGWGWLEVVHPDDKERVAEAFRKSLQLGSDYVIEYRVRRKDGEWRWLSVHGVPMRDHNNRLQEWIGTISDITERKLAEEALRESEERQRTILDHLPVGVWFINGKGKLIYGNKAAITIWGGARYVYIEQFDQYKAWWHGTQRRVLAEEWGGARALRKGEMVVDEILDVECFDGSRKILSSGSVPLIEEGKVIGAVVLNNDITERIRAAEALREAQDRLELAQTVGQVGFFDYDVVHGKAHWSDGLAKLYGIKPGEFEGNYEGWSRRVYPEDLPGVRAILDGAIAQRRAEIDYEFRVILPDGSQRWLAGRGKYFYDDTGAPIRMIGINVDIDDRKMAEEVARKSEELLQSRAKHLETLVRERTAKLQDTIGELEAFSYSISHDMRAPLRSMQGFAQALQEECSEGVGEVGREYLRRISSSAGRMDRLIQDVLTFSRVARTELRLEQVDVNRLLVGILETYPDLLAANAQINVEGLLPAVQANEAALTQCLSNLMENAVKFVAPGVVPKVRIWAESRGQMVRFWFEDNGIGIAPESHERIFGIFQRLSKGYDGTGIGLAIVRKAAERMGGCVGLESVLGRGSKFWLELKQGEEGKNNV